VVAPFGGTTVGVKAKDGVILAADRRMAYGNFVVSRNVRKIHVVIGRVGIGFAGLHGDMSGLLRLLEADLKSYALTTGGKITVYMVAKRLSLVMYRYKMFPFMVEAIVAGIDPDGTPRLYALDALGSITEEDYAAIGSGAPMAYGYLESVYNEDMDVEQAEKAAIEAVRAALGRDASTGDGIDVLVIRGDETRWKTVRLRVTIE